MEVLGAVFTVVFLACLVIFGPPPLRAFVLVAAGCVVVVGLFGVALAAVS